MRSVAILLAAGGSERFGSDKLAVDLGGAPLWKRSFDVLVTHPRLGGVGIVCSEASVASMRQAAPAALFVIPGGQSRQSSCRLGVEVSPDCDLLLIHDAARPFVTHDVISRVLGAAENSGAAAPCIVCADTLRLRAEHGASLLDRRQVVAMQTPQGARRDWLLEAHRAATEGFTDEMALLEAAGFPVELVEGDPMNFKVTHPGDLERAQANLPSVETRTGLGYDVHAFSPDPARKLFLGGIHFPEGPALDGHSDADVLVHAVVDALLGGAVQSDIGTHFDNEDMRWAGASSLLFLTHAAQVLARDGWRIEHIDSTLIAERPKVMARASEMRAAMALALSIGPERISVKATTNEGLGSIGRGEGIAAFAVATIQRG